MPISSYTELKTAVQNWSKRTDTTSLLDDFIDLAEADIWQRLRIRDMDARATATLSTTDRFLALPTGYLEMRKLRILSGSNGYELLCSVPESMAIDGSAGRPTSYCITSQLEFNRTADTAYTAEMNYYKSLTALSSSNTSNAVLTRFPMIYLYGCLFHLGQWAQSDLMTAQYGTLFERAIIDANKADKKSRYGSGKAMRSERATP